MSLAGRSIVVTRDEPPDGPLSSILSGRGARVILLPLVEIHPVEDDHDLAEALRRLGDRDWLMLTSGRAVAALPGAPRCRVAAVGGATAAAWKRLSGRPADCVGSGGGVELLAELGSREPLEGLKIVWPASSRVRPEPIEAARAAGAELTVVTAYRIEPRPDGAAELRRLLREDPPDAVALTSPSAVELLPARSELGERLPVLAAIGATTAAALEGTGWPDPVVAERPGFRALADALAARLADTR